LLLHQFTPPVNCVENSLFRVILVMGFVLCFFFHQILTIYGRILREMLCRNIELDTRTHSSSILSRVESSAEMNVVGAAIWSHWA